MTTEPGSRPSATPGLIRGALGSLVDDRGRGAIAAITAAALVLRVAVAIVAAREPVGLYDPGRYVGYARGIGAGEGMVEPLTGQATAYFPPGYPWFLGVIEWVGVHSPLPDDLALVAGLVQAVLGALTVALAGVVARRVLSPLAGVVAAVIVAVYPNLVLHTASLLSETLSTAVLMAFLLALVPSRGAEPWPSGMSRWRLVAAGVAFGALLLVRPVTGAVVLGATVAWLVAGQGWRRALARTAVIVGLGLLCVAPWTVRNAVRLDAFVLVSTNTGDNLCIGHAPGATGGFRDAPGCRTGSGVQGGTADEVAADREKTRRGLRYWREGWREEPRLTWQRLEILVERDDDSLRAVQSYGLDPWSIGDDYESRARLWDGAWFVVGALGLLGSLRMVISRRGEQVLVPLCAVGVFVAPLLTFADARFKLPAVPLLAIAAGALVVPWRRAGATR